MQPLKAATPVDAKRSRQQSARGFTLVCARAFTLQLALNLIQTVRHIAAARASAEN